MLSLLKIKELGCTKVLTNRNITYKIFKEKLKQIKKETNMSGIRTILMKEKVVTTKREKVKKQIHLSWTTLVDITKL